jgi:hypothetical protein
MKPRFLTGITLLIAVLPTLATSATVPGAPTCPVFPADNAWNKDISALPVAANSDTMISAIGIDRSLHPDFSNHGGYGIPFNIVRSTQTKVRVRFQYAGESDRGPYPIPARPRMEGGSDRHVLIIDRDRCRLYELFAARKVAGRWTAGSGAIFNLRSNKLRPIGWTSADAAGLPIFPGLARAAEVRAGRIDHALRFTAPRTRRSFIFPARHQAGSSDDPNLPPMGLRVRLKASVSLAGFGPQSRVVLQALKRYGMILADNGSPWYITGAPSSTWNDDDLHALGRITGSDFEVVQTTR